MSRTNLYWTNKRGHLCCAHGTILHGMRCVRCERGDLPESRSFVHDVMRAVRQPGGFSDGGMFGFDLGKPGGDQTAFVRGQRVGERIEWTADDLKTAWHSPLNGNSEAMDEIRRRYDEAARRVMDESLRRSAGGRDYYTAPPFNCRSRVDPMWGDGTPMTEDEADLVNGRYRGAEVITDPLDQRGVNARRVGPGA